MRRLRNNCMYLGGLLIISTLDHTQVQSITGRPFLTSSNITTMFTMVALKHSVRAADDSDFYRIQQICCYDHKVLSENPALIAEFKRLCSEKITFVEDWENDVIPPTAMRLYSKKVPVREAANYFIERARRYYDAADLRNCLSDDAERCRISSEEWSEARNQTSVALNIKVKEPRLLLFFSGAVYSCTYNDPNGAFCHSQLVLLYDLPSQEHIDNWQKIPVLILTWNKRTYI